MSIYITLLYSFCAVLALGLGVCVLRRTIQSPSHISFFFLTLAATGWMVFLYLAYLVAPNNIDLTNLFVRILIVWSTLFFYYLVKFYYYFPRIDVTVKKWKWIVFDIVTIGMMGISMLTNLIYKTGIVIDGKLAQDELGSLYILFTIYSLFCIGWALYFLFKKKFHLKGIEKRKVLLSSSGLFTFVILAVATNIVLPIFGVYVLQDKAALFTLFFLFPAFYSIVRYRFLDTRFVITQMLKRVIAFLCGFGTGYFLFHLLNSIIPMEYDIVWYGISFVTGLLLYIKIFRFFNSERVHRFFGTTPLDRFREVLDEFEKTNYMYENILHLEERLQHVFGHSLHIDNLNIILSPVVDVRFPMITEYLAMHDQILVTKEVLIEDKYNEGIKDELKSLGEVCIPVFRSQRNLIGIVVLGKKRFDDPYSVQEIHILRSLQVFLNLTLTGLLYTEQLQIEVNQKTQELKQKNEKLRELDTLKDDFISIASHELRTPLSVIKGYTMFLMDENAGSINELQRQSLGNVLESSTSLLALVNRMLDISSLEAGEMKFVQERFLFSDFLKQIVQEFQYVCEEKSLDLTFINRIDEVGGNLYIKSDPEKIKRILLNLLGNAYKFTPIGGKIDVMLTLNIDTPGYVSVSVRDTGIGIPEDRIPYIFEKFQQVDNKFQKNYSGTGLGLSITKAMVEKLGGTIGVTSEIHHGTCFLFTLPL